MTSVPPSPEERLGTRLEGKYDLLRVCGQGGMGVVLEGVHAWTGRRVAVKLLHGVGGSGSEHLERMLREARTATSLRHPNVVDVLDMGRDGGSPFIVMEYLEGESLDALLGREGPLSPERALALLLPVLGALAMAHDLGIVHRDIKPANIFLSRDPGRSVVPKLLDFGIAQSVSLGTSATKDQVTGTPAYMSPEHARGKGVGPEADVWAMGVLLYRCLSGELPFVGTTPQAVLEEVVEGRQRPLTSLRPELPARFSAAIERALSADPAARYSDMRSFARALLTTAGAAGIRLPAASNLVGLPDTGPAEPAAGEAPRASASPGSPGGQGPGGATDTYQAGPALVDSASSMALERTTTPTSGVGRRRAALGLLALLGALLGVAKLLSTEAAPPGAASALATPPHASGAPQGAMAEPALGDVSDLAPRRTTSAAPGPPPRFTPSATGAMKPGGARAGAPGGVRAAPPASRPPAGRTAPSALEDEAPSVPKIRKEW